ncbi:hypothetical protein ACFQVC_28590 [Streptomyces monticola]|uniref:Secreted protein n=1 Tax=Streptomyces monticola TaxID=2666263 RepID=A0ABW2JRY8_9ACTN
MPHTPRRPLLRPAIGRRALTAGLAVACLTAGTAAASPASRAAGPAVDLSITAQPAHLAPGSRGVQRLSVANAADRATTGPTLVSYATPAYTNIDRKKALPHGCRIAYSNADPIIPEVVTCLLPAGIAKGKDRAVDIPVTVTTRARLTGQVRGRASVLPAPGSKDVEADTNNNWTMAHLSVTRPTPATPPGNTVGLWLAQSDGVVDRDGKAELTLRYGNVGPHRTRDDAKIVLTTPLLIKVDTEEGLPRGCAFALDDRTPGVPQIVVCDRRVHGIEWEDDLTVPLTTQPGVPRGLTSGTALIAPADPGDVDADQTDNLSVAVVRVPARNASTQ